MTRLCANCHTPYHSPTAIACWRCGRPPAKEAAGSLDEPLIDKVVDDIVGELMKGGLDFGTAPEAVEETP